MYCFLFMTLISVISKTPLAKFQEEIAICCSIRSSCFLPGMHLPSQITFNAKLSQKLHSMWSFYINYILHETFTSFNIKLSQITFNVILSNRIHWIWNFHTNICAILQFPKKSLMMIYMRFFHCSSVENHFFQFRFFCFLIKRARKIKWWCTKKII